MVPASLGRQLVAAVAGVLAVTLVALCTVGSGRSSLLQSGPQVTFTDMSAVQRAKYAGAGAASQQLSMVDLSAQQRQDSLAAPTMALASSSDPIPPGHVIHVDMPQSAMQKLKVGSIVKGKVREPMLAADGQKQFDTVDFTGKVRSLQAITVQGKIQSNILGEPDEGVVSVKLLSDQFVAPGTAVSGMVAGKIFKGVVTKAPSFDERMDEAEKRVRELAPPICGEMCQLEREIAMVGKRIKEFKASKNLRKETAALEKRMHRLEHPAPPPETVAILGNWAGFKFDFPEGEEGPNIYGSRIDVLAKSMATAPSVDDYVKAAEPIYAKTRALEKKLDDLQGLKSYSERMELLKKELAAVDNCISKHGTEGRAAPCIQRVQQGGFKSYTNRESEEEFDKDDQFLKPQEGGGGGGGGGGAAESREAAGEEAAEKATWRTEGGVRQRNARRGRGRGREPGAARCNATRGGGARVEELQQNENRRHRAASQRAAGARAWKKFLHQTDRMNHIPSDKDNVMSQW
ncbi:hypothetical protein T484DRAFT_1877322 [Baffinella frigidus]|nr:hypothetical protein T484DRAFT_1877322 [Cryptophyta sp. CCMP2293]